MSRALSAFAQGRLFRACLAGALLSSFAPIAWAGSSIQQNPAITFSTYGTKQVTLQACNAGGCSSITKNIEVLNPQPLVTQASFAPATPEVGQLVLFTGAGTGKPPLAYSWQLMYGGTPVIGIPNQAFWWNTAGWPAGDYQVSLQIQNSAGSFVSTPSTLHLAPTTALDFYTITPCRIYDSRLGLGTSLLSGIARIVQATGLCGIPAGARALAANVTAISPTGSGNVSLYPGNNPPPGSSTVNFQAGITRSNYAVLPLATDGTGTLATLAAIAGSGNTELAIDVSGYFMP
jgi:PKD repeat protein